MKTDFVLELDQKQADVLVLATYEDEDTVEFQKYDKILDGLLSSLKEKKELLGKRKKTKLLHLNESKLHYRALIIAGLGDKKGFSLPRYFDAIHVGVKAARENGYGHVAVLVQDLPGTVAVRACELVTEAAIATARVYDRYRRETKKDLQYIKELSIVGTDEKQRAEFQRAVIIAGAVNKVRDLQDRTAAEMYPEAFAKEAKLSHRKLNCTIWDEKTLRKNKYNGILAVGQGSVHPPRLVTLEHKPRKAKKTVCLVGKGITFDSGGLNLKPSGYMEDMKYDMSGAAVVLGIMEAIAELQLNVRVVGIMGLAENAIDGGAYRPSDVITSAAGVTIEVGNTDAEGRIVLADALHHAQQYKPDHIVDFATLTGAVVVALGHVGAGVMGNDQELVDAILAHGEATGERVWQLPLWEEYEEDIASDFADIKNIGKKREAGTITAAFFLKQFVGEASWAHIDIAGTAMVDRTFYFTKVGGTGFGVRLIVDWLSTF